MRNVITPLLIALVGILAYLAYSQRVALQQQRQVTQELNAKFNALAAGSIDLQEKCAKQALEEFKFEGLQEHKEDKLASFSDHYNVKLNRCFVQIYYADARQDGSIFMSETLVDAFEGKLYGHYLQRTNKTKTFPADCKITLVTGTEKSCDSLPEFESLTKQYME
jgi:hypothetical protein